MWLSILRIPPLKRKDESNAWDPRARPWQMHHKAKGRKPRSQHEKVLHLDAMTFKREGKTKKALRVLKDGMAMYPHNVFFASSAGAILHKQRRLDEAEAAFQQALAVEPENSVALQSYARLLASKGDIERARDMFEKATQVG
jgi:Flp pilus assembly protein TadD